MTQAVSQASSRPATDQLLRSITDLLDALPPARAAIPALMIECLTPARIRFVPGRAVIGRRGSAAE